MVLKGLEEQNGTTLGWVSPRSCSAHAGTHPMGTERMNVSQALGGRKICSRKPAQSRLGEQRALGAVGTPLLLGGDSVNRWGLAAWRGRRRNWFRV